ncbi:Response regulator receiver domain-containing protein [Dehalogenimonas formicexedens]|uniref:Response regulator receiver domain-containing protein n=2 Tax=Dehalogenimonas TaxID=670486 RepID=A0A1P8F5S9_9CHLR|nr:MULTISPECIES: response regulator [Dehalogenimonas]APV43846.1 Response regulator receiver domain-containing protein [Dehalogenimonas formicexedens]KTB49315.1 Response regulator receiver domain [Dehalogenimonas alkenigignens]
MAETINKTKILVVEDEFNISDVCKNSLIKEGYDVTVSADGLSAKRLISATEYDLIVLDLNIPKISGIELYHWLEGEHPELTRRVLFMTGLIPVGGVAAFLAHTGRLCLQKPFTPKELRDKVKQVLEPLGKL